MNISEKQITDNGKISLVLKLYTYCSRDTYYNMIVCQRFICIHMNVKKFSPISRKITFCPRELRISNHKIAKLIILKNKTFLNHYSKIVINPKNHVYSDAVGVNTNFLKLIVSRMFWYTSSYFTSYSQFCNPVLDIELMDFLHDNVVETWKFEKHYRFFNFMNFIWFFLERWPKCKGPSKNAEKH